MLLRTKTLSSGATAKLMATLACGVRDGKAIPVDPSSFSHLMPPASRKYTRESDVLTGGGEMIPASTGPHLPPYGQTARTDANAFPLLATRLTV
jgi:hypothetical protein